MMIEFSNAQAEIVHAAIEHGHARTADEFIDVLIGAWQEREAYLHEMQQRILVAKESLGRGKGRLIANETMQDLASAIHADEMDRLAAGASRVAVGSPRI